MTNDIPQDKIDDRNVIEIYNLVNRICTSAISVVSVDLDDSRGVFGPCD